MPAPTSSPATKVYFGVVFELFGEVIALEPKNAISEIKTKGIECGLKPGQKIRIGTVGTRLKQILTGVGLEESQTTFIKADGNFDDSQLPDIGPLKNAIGLLTQANLTIEDFHIRIPPSAAPAAGANATPAPKQGTGYTVGLSAVWTEDSGKLIDGLDIKLRGVFFKVSNEGL
jgi:hypothetical protein